MNTIERLEALEVAQENAITYSESLINALAPDPSEWEYSGIVTDSVTGASCACGHPIRYCSHIERKRDSATAIVGSTCINNFAAINPGLHASLVTAHAGLVEQLEAAKKAAKQAQEQAKVQAAREQFEKIYDAGNEAFWSYRNSGRLAPRDLWWLFGSRKRIVRDAPVYQRASAYLKWYEKYTAAIAEAVNHG